MASDTDPYAFSGGTALFTTGTTYGVKMTVKVWIEGWQQESSSYIWDDENIGVGFNLNMRFGCQAER